MISTKPTPGVFHPIQSNIKYLEFGSEVKFLGILIDSSLKFLPHIRYICDQISKNIGLFYKLRNFVNISYLINCERSEALSYVMGFKNNAQTHCERMRASLSVYGRSKKPHKILNNGPRTIL